jgi:hypothetical protein
MSVPGNVILEQLIDAAGTEAVAAFGEDALGDLADQIADYKHRYETETDPREKHQIEKDLCFLQARLLLRVEARQVRASNRAEAALRKAVGAALDAAFPFLC